MHHLSITTYHPTHWVGRMDARIKVVAAFALLVMVTSCKDSLFPSILCILCLGVCLSLRVPLRKIALRFTEPAFIAATLVVLKVFFSGSVPLFSLHFLGMDLVGHEDGLREGLALAARIAGGVSVVAVLGFSTSFTDLMAALSWLRVPRTLVEVALFAWRYLFLLIEDAQVVYHAQKNRLGYCGCLRGMRSMGALAGVLVLKAFDSSQSITTAMSQRGYNGQMPLLQHKPFVAAEIVCTIFFLAGMALLRGV